MFAPRNLPAARESRSLQLLICHAFPEARAEFGDPLRSSCSRFALCESAIPFDAASKLLRSPSLEEAGAGAEQVARALKNSLVDDRGRWSLRPHPEAATEYRVRLRGEVGLRAYVLDRLFRDTDLVRWIVEPRLCLCQGPNAGG